MYLISEGMPYLANIRYEEDSARLYLHDFFNSVQLKDIVKHDKMRDVDLFYQVKRKIYKESRFFPLMRNIILPTTASVKQYLVAICAIYVISFCKKNGTKIHHSPLKSERIGDLLQSPILLNNHIFIF